MCGLIILLGKGHFETLENAVNSDKQLATALRHTNLYQLRTTSTVATKITQFLRCCNNNPITADIKEKLKNTKTQAQYKYK